MDFLLALVIISPALFFLWLALIRYHAREGEENKQEEQIFVPPTLPKIIPREPVAESTKESVPVQEPIVETKTEEPIKAKSKSKSAKPKSEKSIKPKQSNIKRAK